MNSISLLVIGLFKLSISHWVICSSLCFMRNWSISSKLSNICVNNYLQYSLIIFFMSIKSVMRSPVSFLTLVTCVSLGCFFWGGVTLVSTLLIILIFLKNEPFVSLIFSIFLLPISLISDLYYFLLSASFRFMLLFNFQILGVRAQIIDLKFSLFSNVYN